MLADLGTLLGLQEQNENAKHFRRWQGEQLVFSRLGACSETPTRDELAGVEDSNAPRLDAFHALIAISARISDPAIPINVTHPRRSPITVPLAPHHGH